MKIQINDRGGGMNTCTHPRLDEVETQKGDCSCGCRDYKWCPECDEAVEVQ